MVHTPVLINEVLKYLNPKSGQKFIDATINGGGHAFAILEKIGSSGKLLGIEWDRSLAEKLKLKIDGSEFKNNIFLINDSYVNLIKIAEQNGFTDVDGVLFDLGISSWHFEESGRGFTFQKDEPLDMRFSGPKDQNHPGECFDQTAENIIQQWSYDDLAQTFTEYGGERFAKRIAAAIARERKEKPIRTTFQLVEIIKKAVPFWYRHGRRIHYATKTFQALRMAVNCELENIEKGLARAIEVLKSGGVLAVISFHSVEDRVVKNFFRENIKSGLVESVIKKPVLPGIQEINENPRSRSSKLRVVRKK